MFFLYYDRTLPLFWILFVALAPPTSITVRLVTSSLGVAEAVCFSVFVYAMCPFIVFQLCA